MRNFSVIGSFLFLMLGFVCVLKGQTTINQYTSFIPPSPTAASLGKYGDIPVNLANGTPNINIPLYTLKSRELSMDISLSYHAGGIKLDELPSWVGMGWSLNAGGVITRKQNDAPDEVLLNGWLSTSYRNALHDCMNNSNVNCPFPNCVSSFYHNNIAGTCSPTWVDISDNEPDEFFYNFEGYSGKFIFGEDGLPICIPKNNLKIEWTKQYFSGAMILANFINQFIITTPNGTKYIFGMHKYKDGEVRDNREVSVKYGIDDNDYPDGIVNSWYLCAVVKDKNFISYNTNLVNYNEEQNYALNSDIIELFYEDENSLLRYRNILSKTVTHCENPLNGSVEDSDITPPSSPPVFFNYIKRLQKICSDDKHIVFSAPSQGGEYLFYKSTDNITNNTILNTSNAKRLDKIEIKNNQNQTISSYILDYNDNWANNQYRLYLTSIAHSDINSITKPPYLFEYYNIGALPEPIWLLGTATQNHLFAGVHSLKGIDHWGFYNGVSNNSYGFPTSSITVPFLFTVSGDAPSSRESNEEAMKSGILTKIIYPTGGYTEFVFEANRMAWCSIPTLTGYFLDSRYQGEQSPENLNALNNAGILVGGLRVKEIIDCPIGDCNINPANKIIKKYLYEQEYEYNNNFYQVSSGVLGGIPLSGFVKTNTAYNNNGIPFVQCAEFQITSQPLVPIVSAHGTHITYQKVTEIHYNSNNHGKTNYFFTTALNYPDVKTLTYDILYPQIIVFQSIPMVFTQSTALHPKVPLTQYSWKRGDLIKKQVYDKNNQIKEETLYEYKYGDELNANLPTDGETKIRALRSEEIPLIYLHATAFKFLKSETLKRFSGGNVFTAEKEYFYDNPIHYQISRIQETNSDGIEQTIKYKYVPDLLNLSPTPNYPNNFYGSNLLSMHQKHNFALCETRREMRKNSVDYLLSAEFIKYKPLFYTSPSPASITSQREMPEEVWQLSTNVPIQMPFISSELDANGTLILDNRYQRKYSFDYFNNVSGLNYRYHRMISSQKENDIKTSFLWDKLYIHPIAEGINLERDDMAFTSFEEGANNGDSNWDFMQGQGSINNAEYKTGTASLQLSANQYLISAVNSASKVRTLSFWVKGTVGQQIEIASDYNTSAWNTLTLTGSWEQHTLVLPANTQVVLQNIGTNPIYLDDVRLYLPNCFMINYIYNVNAQLIAKINSNGVYNHYLYDSFGRLEAVKDDDGNILQKETYHYK